MNLACRFETVRQMPAVADIATVDQDLDVPANGILVIEYPATDFRPGLKVALQQIGQRVRLDVCCRALDMPFQIRGKRDLRHRPQALAADRMPKGVRSKLRQFSSGISAVEMNAYCPVSAAWLMPSVKTIQADPGGKRIS